MDSFLLRVLPFPAWLDCISSPNITSDLIRQVSKNSVVLFLMMDYCYYYYYYYFYYYFPGETYDLSGLKKLGSLVLEWLIFADGFVGGNGATESDCTETLDGRR